MNAEAYQLYLDGRREWNQRSAESLVRARLLFERSIALDPNFARAHAGLADALLIQGGQFTGAEYDDLARQAEAEAQVALKLDPGLAEGHATLGVLASRNEEHAKSEAFFKQALQLNPNYATAHQWYGRELLRLGDVPGAIAELKRAIQLDPLAPVIYSNLAFVYVTTRQFDLALAAAEASLAIAPGYTTAKSARAQSLGELGRKDEALKALAELLSLQPGQMSSNTSRYAENQLGWSSFRAVFEGPPAVELQLKRVQAEFPNRNDVKAWMLATLGRFDEALIALQDSVGTKYVSMNDFLDAYWDPVRKDPRFRKALVESGTAEAHDKIMAYIEAQKRK